MTFKVGDRVVPNDEAQKYYTGKKYENDESTNSDFARRSMTGGIVTELRYDERGENTHRVTGYTVVSDQGLQLSFKADTLSLECHVIQEIP